MKYPPQFLDNIRQHFRISEVISSRMQLKRHGREFMGLCPFHSEKTPSFTVNDEKGFFHCFGCNAHGDVIGFIKDYDNIHFVEAIKYLADQAGLKLPEATPEQQQQFDKNEVLYQIMEKTTVWFEQQLHSTVNGRKAKEYLKNRGLSDEIIRFFRIGFAENNRTALKDYLISSGIKESLLHEAGLLSKPDNGSSYDKFRDRIIFPITNSSGKVIAFGGRLISENSKAPKYLNSPETPLFKKGHILFNAANAKKIAARSGEIIVTEGYMDVIALHQHGIKNAVAPLGTAITPEQIKILWQFADEPTLCLDGDTAGERAMLRAADLVLPMLQPNKSLSFCNLPNGEDPDSILQSQGSNAMQKILASSVALVDVIWHKHYASQRISTPEQQSGAEKILFRNIHLIQDENVKQNYIAEMKNRIWQSKRFSSDSRSNTNNKNRKTLGSPKAKYNNLKPASIKPPAPIANQDSYILQCQQNILMTIILYPAIFRNDHVENVIINMDIKNASTNALAQYIIQQLTDDENIRREKLISNLQNHSDGNLKNTAEKLLANFAHDINSKRIYETAEHDGQSEAENFINILIENITNIQTNIDHRQASSSLMQNADDETMQKFTHINELSRSQHTHDNFFDANADEV